MKKVRIGMIGSGYIGRTHAIAFAQAPTVFALNGELIKEMIAEITPELAAERAQQFGFNRSTADWKALVADPDIDVVDICAPNYLHYDMALAAIAHGKHVYAEKPLALNAKQAKVMADAANQAGVITLVGFNYMRNPAAALAKQIIASGEIGDIVHFYGSHNEDYLADANKPIDWHCLKRTAGLGTLGDLAAHIVNMAHFLVGDIAAVCGDLQTVIKTRPETAGSAHQVAVENEDQAHALLRFHQGAIGIIESSRIACGRKMGLNYTITGSKGTLMFTQERLAELKLYRHDDPVNRQGFKTLLIGPQHPDYAEFCAAAGHGFGFNDQKTIEVRDLINAVASNTAVWPDFTEGWKVSCVLDAIAQSYQQGCWVSIADHYH